MMKEILPCKFCRASTKEFTESHPLKGDPGKWLYDIHNMVNHKLRTQCKEDPQVIDPGPDPTFEEVKDRYMKLKLNDVPGRDFLMSIAVNYPDKPEQEDMARQRMFIHKLSEVYPFDKLRKVFKKYLAKNEVALDNNKEYTKWMYSLISTMIHKMDKEITSYNGYVQRVKYYSSGCEKKTYKGKTCRRGLGGGYTKSRDHRRTQRVTGMSLL